MATPTSYKSLIAEISTTYKIDFSTLQEIANDAEYKQYTGAHRMYSSFLNASQVNSKSPAAISIAEEQQNSKSNIFSNFKELTLKLYNYHLKLHKKDTELALQELIELGNAIAATPASP